MSRKKKFIKFVKEIPIKNLPTLYTTEEREVEIYTYKGFKFGLYWKDTDCPNSKSIQAVELGTGAFVKKVYSKLSKAPKRDLITFLQKVVDNGELDRGIRKVRRKIDAGYKDLREILDSYPCFPINS